MADRFRQPSAKAESVNSSELFAYSSVPRENITMFSPEVIKCRSKIGRIRGLNSCVGINRSVPIGNRYTQQADTHQQILSVLRRLDAMCDRRQAHRVQIRRGKPRTASVSNFNQDLRCAQPAFEVLERQIEINQRHFATDSLLLPTRAIWEEDCKERYRCSDPGSQGPDGVPPDDTVVNAQRAAAKNSIKPCHSSVPLWTGPYSAMQKQLRAPVHG